jgi:hypothetical protein
MFRPLHFLTKSLAAAIATLSLSAPAFAADDMPDDEEAIFGGPVMNDSELSDQRGGFAFSGMEIKLGADIRTFLNNELALHTVITMDENGYSRVQTVGAGLTLADADSLRNNVLSNGAIRMNIGDSQVFLANEGRTAIVHGNEGALQNILINTASNITATQDVTATLDVNGYENFASTITADQLGRSLGEDITRAITGSFGL